MGNESLGQSSVPVPVVLIPSSHQGQVQGQRWGPGCHVARVVQAGKGRSQRRGGGQPRNRHDAAQGERDRARLHSLAWSDDEVGQLDPVAHHRAQIGCSPAVEENLIRLQPGGPTALHQLQTSQARSRVHPCDDRIGNAAVAHADAVGQVSDYRLVRQSQAGGGGRYRLHLLGTQHERIRCDGCNIRGHRRGQAQITQGKVGFERGAARCGRAQQRIDPAGKAQFPLQTGQRHESVARQQLVRLQAETPKPGVGCNAGYGIPQCRQQRGRLPRAENIRAVDRAGAPHRKQNGFAHSNAQLSRNRGIDHGRGKGP